MAMVAQDEAPASSPASQSLEAQSRGPPERQVTPMLERMRQQLRLYGQLQQLLQQPLASSPSQGTPPPPDSVDSRRAPAFRCVSAETCGGSYKP
ncbi:hypothetical protein cyc_08562 [Cyclospora cayetanensis]|uniref:Uncharacterized protein n=1 Tax=Cyclospora cayetanensis TaxID=88456 RepID=A0A1D3D6U0_9EIME|nr:hypothetical protein cyc_08562 [Cyclospora cayetanensis]